MSQVTFRQFSFGSFFKLTMTLAASIGIALGVLFFLLAFFGTATWNGAEVTSVSGKVAVGIGGFILMPIFSMIMGAISSVIGYLPSKLVLRLTKGVTMEATEQGV